VSAGDVGEFGAARDRVVLGKVQFERSFAGPRFVTVTVVIAKGIGYLLLSLGGAHDCLSPDDIRHGTAGPGLAILVTPGAARSDGFTLLRAFAGRATGLPLGGPVHTQTRAGGAARVPTIRKENTL
jgi:hypothetical protein